MDGMVWEGLSVELGLWIWVHETYRSIKSPTCQAMESDVLEVFSYYKMEVRESLDTTSNHHFRQQVPVAVSACADHRDAN